MAKDFVGRGNSTHNAHNTRSPERPSVTVERAAQALRAHLTQTAVDRRKPHHAVPADRLARLLALLVRAVPYVPSDLASEIRVALSEGG
jgi:hypothetical protein